jgi:hypothetical protein
MGVALIAAAAEASETVVDFSSTTLVASQPEWRDGVVRNTVPAFERVAVSAFTDETGWVKELRFDLSAWAGVDTSVVHRDNAAVTGDVDLAFIQGKLFDRHVTLTLGRQLISGGSARLTPVDGGNAEWRVWKGLGIQGYGGVPAVPRFAVARGDGIGGARLFWRQSYSTEAGISFTELLDRGITARRDLGFDARYVPFPKWTLNGYALWSLLESRIAEGELAAQWQAITTLLVSASYRRTAHDLFISRASIFSVFAENRRDEVGGSAAWRPRQWFDFYVDARAISMDSGGGLDTGARVTAKLRIPSTLGAQVRVLHVPFNGYTGARLWAQHWFSPTLFATLDLDSYFLNHSVNGKRQSLSASVSGSYAFLPHWRAVLTAIAGETPFFSSQFQVFAKVAYDFTFHIRERRP